MMRLTVLIYVSIVLLGSSCTQKPVENPNEKPNIVIFLADDQGWGDLSASGNINIETPNIDALANQGISFERFFVCPVCSPTRAEFLTGRYHPRGGVYSTSAGGERLDLDETTIADVFKQAGYATAAFGKWHNGMQYPYHPNGRGFDEFYGFCSGHWGNYFSPMLEHNGQIVYGEGYLPDDLTGKAIDFIEKNREQPFFVYIPFNTPHSPMQVPDAFYEKFENTPLRMTHREKDKEDTLFTKAALAMCENIDWNVGRLMKTLDDLNLSDNTIVVYFTDNGPNSFRWNGGMKGKKGNTDEGGVRSPLFIRWGDKLEKGKVIPEIAGAIDLLPTLAGLAGIPAETNKPLDGISLEPLITDKKATLPERYVFNYWAGRTSVRSQKFRLDHEGNLYDMVNDPGQTTVVNNMFSEETEAMKKALTHWEETVLAEFPDEDLRLFPVGHPDYRYTQLPARDGIASGNIQRSNRWPNCSFYTNWTSLEDKIIWPVEVLHESDYDVTIYYTCAPENVGASFSLTFGDNALESKITEAHDPPLKGMEHDRIERQESYVKDFQPMHAGTVHLTQGKGELILQATDIPGEAVMDFRLMMLKRLTN